MAYFINALYDRGVIHDIVKAFAVHAQYVCSCFATGWDNSLVFAVFDVGKNLLGRYIETTQPNNRSKCSDALSLPHAVVNCNISWVTCMHGLANFISLLKFLSTF